MKKLIEERQALIQNGRTCRQDPLDTVADQTLLFFKLRYLWLKPSSTLLNSEVLSSVERDFRSLQTIQLSVALY